MHKVLISVLVPMRFTNCLPPRRTLNSKRDQIITLKEENVMNNSCKYKIGNIHHFDKETDVYNYFIVLNIHFHLLLLTYFTS